MSQQTGKDSFESNLMASSPAEDEYQFWVEEKLRNMDTDQYGHVNNAAIAMFCESGRTSIFADPTLATDMQPYSIVVARLLIEFHDELFFPGIVRIGTTVTDVGNSSLQISQAIFKTGDRVATSKATCVMLDRSAKQPARVPDAVRAYLQDVRPTHCSKSHISGVFHAD